MDVRTISCNKKITVELEVNVDTIEYVPRDNAVNKKFENCFLLNFHIGLFDGTSYAARIWNWDFSKYIYLVVENVKSLTGTASIMVSKNKLISKDCNGCRVNSAGIRHPDKLVPSLSIEFTGKLEFLKGSFTITFEPTDEKILDENFKNTFNLMELETFKSPKDIKLVVEGREFEFNKACLAGISSFFRDTFENYPGETKIPMIECSVQDVGIFKNILDKKCLKSEQITVDLFKFADKFEIQPLLKICRDYFGRNIKKENMFEIALIANMVNDDCLMKKVAYFFSINRGKDVDDFLNNNPNCGLRLFKAMMKSNF